MVSHGRRPPLGSPLKLREPSSTEQVPPCVHGAPTDRECSKSQSVFEFNVLLDTTRAVSLIMKLDRRLASGLAGRRYALLNPRQELARPSQGGGLLDSRALCICAGLRRTAGTISATRDADRDQPRATGRDPQQIAVPSVASPILNPLAASNERQYLNRLLATRQWSCLHT